MSTICYSRCSHIHPYHRISQNQLVTLIPQSSRRPSSNSASHYSIATTARIQHYHGTAAFIINLRHPRHHVHLSRPNASPQSSLPAVASLFIFFICHYNRGRSAYHRPYEFLHHPTLQLNLRFSLRSKRFAAQSAIGYCMPTTSY